MAESPRMLVQDLRRLVNPLRLEETDGQLLSAFADSQDQDAFEALVRRHGPPVFAICRRVIGQTSGADDAFQVTFFTLARKARSLRKQQAVGAWLYRVAHRVACRARIGEQRRRQVEAAMKNIPSPCASTNAQSGELLAALEAELAELPEKYRAPLLLCGVEEKTHEEAARILGQPLGSMSNLLARGRALLRQRLARRGFTIGAGTLALLNAANAQAMVPAVLLQATVRDALPVVLKSTIAGATAHLSPNVASLLKEALRAMFWTKGKLSVLFLTMGLIFAVVGGSLGLGKGEMSGNTPPADAPVAAAPAAPADQPAAIPPANKLPPGDDKSGSGDAKAPSSLRFEDGVTGVTFLGDGKRFAALNNNRIRIFETATAKEVRSWQADEHVNYAIAATPDGKRIASAGNNKMIRLWDADTGKMIREFNNHRGERVSALAFAPDGKHLVSLGDERELTNGKHVMLDRPTDDGLRVWDSDTGLELPAFKGGLPAGFDPAFSADGKHLIWRDSLILRDSRDWRAGQAVFHMRPLAGGEDRVWDLNVASDKAKWDSPFFYTEIGYDPRESGAYFVDWQLVVWDGNKERELRRFPIWSKEGHSQNTIRFSPDHSIVASCDQTNTITLYYPRTDTSRVLAQFAPLTGMYGLDFTRDGRTLIACAGKEIRWFDVAAGKEQGADKPPLERIVKELLKDGPAGIIFEGVVKELRKEGNQVSVLVERADMMRYYFYDLQDGTRIVHANGEKATATDLKVGVPVTVYTDFQVFKMRWVQLKKKGPFSDIFSPGRAAAYVIVINGLAPAERGVIKKIEGKAKNDSDAEGTKILVEGGKDGKAWFLLDKQTTIIKPASQQKATAADLKVGLRVSVYHGPVDIKSSPPGADATLIVIEDPPTFLARVPDGYVNHIEEGIIKEVPWQGLKGYVLVERANKNLVIYRVTEQTSIFHPTQKISTEADLKVGMKVWVQTTREQTDSPISQAPAFRIAIEYVAEGIIKQVPWEGQKGYVLVERAKQNLIIFRVTKETVIVHANQQKATEADLRAGMKVRVHTTSEQTLSPIPEAPAYRIVIEDAADPKGPPPENKAGKGQGADSAPNPGDKPLPPAKQEECLPAGKEANKPGADEDQQEGMQPVSDPLEAPLPRGAILRLGTTRFRPGQGNAELKLSPDGKKLMTHQNEGSGLSVWDAASGKLLLRRLLGREGQISRDGERLLVIETEPERPDDPQVAVAWPGGALPGQKNLADLKCDLKIYDIKSSQRLQQIRTSQALVHFAIAPDERTLALEYADPPGANEGGFSMFLPYKSRVELYDLKAGRVLHKLPDALASTGLSRCVRYSADGKTLFAVGISLSGNSNSYQATIRRFDVATGALQSTKKVDDVIHSHCHVPLHTPAGKTLIAWGATIWDLDNDRLQWTSKGGLLSSIIGFMPDGHTLVGVANTHKAVEGGMLSNLVLWDMKTDREVRRLSCPSAEMAFSPDGKVGYRAATGYGAYGATPLRWIRWDLGTGKEIDAVDAPTEPPGEIALSPDDKYVATRDQQKLRIWDRTTGKCLHEEAKDLIFCPPLCFTPDSKSLMLGIGIRSSGFRMLDTATWKTFEQEFDDVQAGMEAQSFRLSPDGKMLAGPYNRWNYLSPEGKKLAGPYRVWDFASGKVVLEIPNSDPVATKTLGGFAFGPVEFSPDSKRAVCFASPDRVTVWDLTTKKLVNSWPVQVEIKKFVNLVNLRFVKNGELVAGCSTQPRPPWKGMWRESPWGNEPPPFKIEDDWPETKPPLPDAVVYVWDPATGKEKYRFQYPQNEVHSDMPPVFSPDGKLLVKANRYDEFVHFLDTATGKEVGRFNCQVKDFHTLAFSPDSQVLAVSAGDTTVLLVDVRKVLNKP